MLKRIMFTGMALLLIYSGILVGYKIFEPQKTAETTIKSTTQATIDYETLKDYTLNSGASVTHYYFFCSAASKDCIYMENTVLKSVAVDTKLNLDDYLEYVDVSSLEESLTTNRLGADWGISSYPAFLSCSVKDGQIIINNSLQWDPKTPLSEDNVIAWLAQNGIYKNASSAEPIASAAS